jgi:hypothetical protein
MFPFVGNFPDDVFLRDRNGSLLSLVVVQVSHTEMCMHAHR